MTHLGSLWADTHLGIPGQQVCTSARVPGRTPGLTLGGSARQRPCEPVLMGLCFRPTQFNSPPVLAPLFKK